jgi:hypothetical protein
MSMSKQQLAFSSMVNLLKALGFVAVVDAVGINMLGNREKSIGNNTSRNDTEGMMFF